MQPAPTHRVDPDAVVNNAMQSVMGVMRAKENLEVHLKQSHDMVEAQAQTIGLMKNRILELEKEVQELKDKKKVEELIEQK